MDPVWSQWYTGSHRAPLRVAILGQLDSLFPVCKKVDDSVQDSWGYFVLEEFLGKYSVVYQIKSFLEVKHHYPNGRTVSVWVFVSRV